MKPDRDLTVGQPFNLRVIFDNSWNSEILGIDDRSPQLRELGLMAVLLHNLGVFTVPRDERYKVGGKVRVQPMNATCTYGDKLHIHIKITPL